MLSRYDQLKEDAIADCKAGRFADAQRKLGELIKVLRRDGAPLASSPTMYWYLVALHNGDETRAMEEFVRLE